MSWSAPCEPIDRKAPPSSPAHRVYGRPKSSAGSMATSFPASAARVRMPDHPSGTAWPSTTSAMSPPAM